ncbi:MAG: glycosyl hydrolase-related protein [Tannerella sp.]|nr:glycosyl hydrolase-related protein [Tannerella sp.]
MKKLIIALIVAGTICSPAGLQAQRRNMRQQRDTIHVVGHAHMDMNWLWTYSETMKMANDNLRQAVAFMDEYPDYTMLQSQGSVYKFVEMVDPPLFELVKKYVREGRLELAGGMWTEGDANLSSGEALTRSFLLGQRYFQKNFGKTAKIGWLPDNFGHPSQLPQLLKLAGCDYFYFHRTKPYKGTFWWTGTDGSTVLCYANDTYNGRITPELKDELQKITPDKHRLLFINGIGDHGGGPTRAEIELAHQLDRQPGYPAVKYTSVGEFFNKVSNEMDGRPTHHGEMQFIFEGCYTTVAEIKAGNRNSENSLFRSEFFNTLRWLQGDTYPANELRDLWTTLTFNQFHDILPGSAIYEANKEAIARYTEVQRMSKELGDFAFRKMADEVKFKTGMGQPVVAYNLQPVGRKVLVEAEVYSHETPVTINPYSWGDYYNSKIIRPVDKGQGNTATVLVRDASGKTYPAQIVWSKTTPPGVTSKIQFVADDFPAGGYRTFYVDTEKPGVENTPIPFNNNTFETEYFTIKVDMSTGGITSLIDKRTKTEYVRDGGKLNTLRISLEDRRGGMKSWVINKTVDEYNVTDVRSVKLVENGPVRACIETEKVWGKSKFIERMYIYSSYPRIDYDMEVHWLETGTRTADSPMLRAVFPLALQDARFYCQTPFDIVERPADGKIGGQPTPPAIQHRDDYGTMAETKDGQEVPAQKWVDVNNGQQGIALLNRTKYGHSYHNGDLKMTLLRSAGDPDIYPNLGKFNISYALYPHASDWKSAVWQEGDNFNIPVMANEPPSQAIARDHATRPEEASFFALAPGNVSLTGMKQSEEGNELIVRIVEIEGKDTAATLELPFTARTARRLNLIEYPLNDASQPIVTGQTLTVKLKPNEIVTLGITK